MKYLLVAWVAVKAFGLKVYPGAKAILRKLGGYLTTVLNWLHLVNPVAAAAPASTPATNTTPAETKGSRMLAVLELLGSPLVRYIGIGLIGLSVVAFLFGKGVAWEHKHIVNEIQMESKNAIVESGTARASAVKRFDAGRVHNDGFARD